MNTTSGKIVEVGQVKKVGQKNFPVQDIVIESTENNWTEYTPLTMKGDKLTEREWNVGDFVEVEFKVGGRKWDGPNGTKYFASVYVTRVVRHDLAGPSNQSSPF